jgi:hypothetical protein
MNELARQKQKIKEENDTLQNAGPCAIGRDYK